MPFITGERTWRVKRDSDGHRNYTLKTRVHARTWHGPATVLQTPGLPVVGSWWIVSLPNNVSGAVGISVPGIGTSIGDETGLGYNYGDVLTVSGGTLLPADPVTGQPQGQPAIIVVSDIVPDSGAIIAAVIVQTGDYQTPPTNPVAVTGGTGTGAHFNIVWQTPAADIDLWAQCKWDADVTPVVENEPNTEWEVEQEFSTKPDLRCQKAHIEDPLQIPQEISGDSIKYTEQATKDRFNNPILNSAWEPIRGPQVEFDKNRATFSITQNVPHLEQSLWQPMIDSVNQFPIWDYPARCVKLSNVKFQRKFFGTCFIYFTRTFQFDTNTKSITIPASDTVTGATPANAGVGYSNSDILMVAGGFLAENGQPCTLQPTVVSGSIVSLTVINGGNYATDPPSPAFLLAQEGSTGLGATANLTFGAIESSKTLVSGFDRDIVDEGTKVLAGDWINGVFVIRASIQGHAPDPNNPADFIKYKDPNNENARVLYDPINKGQPWTGLTGISAMAAAIKPGDTGGGYVVGDILTVQGGTTTNSNPPSATTLKVTEVTPPLGNCKFVVVDKPGSYKTVPPNPVACLGGSGNNLALFNITWQMNGSPEPNSIHVEKYEESDFLKLGIPSDLESIVP